MATYIGKVNVGGSELPVGSTLYGTCATGAGTAAKVVTMANFDELLTGVTIHVKFTYSNTVANPTLNVNGTGAKTIYRYGTTAPSTSAETSWNAGAVVSFTYDGSYWQMNDWVNDNTKYTPASATPVMDGTAAVGTSAKYAREDHVHPSDTSRVPTTRTVNGKALSSNISLTASDVSAIATSAKGAAGGVAELDSNGLVPTSQLPSFVDDVLEYLSKSSFPTTGETGKIYVDTTTNLTYRWSGSAYVEISPSLALGTTSSTAFRGDQGKTAYDHASAKGSAFSSGLYKITTNAEGHVTAATAVAKSDITALGIPGSDTDTWNAMTGATSSANGTVGYVNAVPPKDGYNTKYLRADGTWAVPPDNNTWNAMTGATSSANGTVGYVNAVPPKDGYNTKYLRADGTWSVPPDNNTKYGLSISGHTVSIVEGGSTSSVTVPDNNTTYGLSISGHTVSLVEGGTTASVTVPDNNDNNAVTQTATSTSANYEVLFSATADNTTRTEGARKNNNLTFNPNTGNLQVTQINGVTVGSSPKFTDTDTNTKYGLSISGHTVSLVEGGTTASVTVPDNNDNNAVTQTATTTNAAYEVLFSATADNTTRTEGARKNSNMTFNPSTGNLAVTQINGVTVGSSPKFTDNNTKYGLSISGHTVSLVEGGTTASVTVPDNNDNNAVTQTATSTSANYEVLFSATADNTTRTEGARKNNNLTFNPNTGNLQVTQINGVTVGSSPKFTDNNTTYGLSISGHTVSLVSGGTTSSVTVPDNNTTYSAGTGLSLSGTTFNHSNSVTAGTAGTSSATSGRSIAVPYVTYDAQGHITASGTHTHTASVPPSGVVRGDDSTVGGLDPVTAAYIPTAASNKSFGLPAAAIKIEYSTDAGSTWTDYGATDAEKRNLFNESRATNFYLGKASAKANNSVNNRLRVTIEPTERYCSFHGIYVWFSTAGNTTVMDLERSTIGAKDTFTTVFTGQALSGWSGNNIRYFAYGTFGGGSTQTSNAYKYRITFRQTAINANYGSSNLSDIRFLGDNIWTYPGEAYNRNMLMHRTAYSTDASGNVTFPGEVTATDFNGTVNGYSIAASVPSGAKFTDTTYTANTTSIGSASGWSAGSAPSLSYTSRSIPNVTSVGSVPSLSYTARSVGSASGWSAGTAASASVSNGVLTITNGTAPSLTVTSVACDDITSWDAGSTPTLGTAISADDITAWSAGSVPSLTVTSKTVATGITAN